jgi:hypothetical protein
VVLRAADQLDDGQVSEELRTTLKKQITHDFTTILIRITQRTLELHQAIIVPIVKLKSHRHRHHHHYRYRHHYQHYHHHRHRHHHHHRLYYLTPPL